MGNIFDDIRDASPFWIFASIATAMFSHWSRASRWVIALRPLGYKTRTFTAFLAVMFGYFANFFIPRIGEVMRCGLFNRTEKVPVNVSFGTVLAERALDLIILLTLTAVVFLMEFDRVGDFVVSQFSDNSDAMSQKLYLLGAFALVGVFGLVGLYLLRNWLVKLPIFLKLKDFALGMKDGLLSVRKLSPKQQFLFIAHTVNIWVMYYLMSYVLFFSLEATSALSPMAGLTVLIMGGIGMAIPSPGGVGTYHLFIATTLVAYGLDEGISKNFAFLMHSVQSLAVLLIGGLSFLVSIFIARKKGESVSEVAEDVVDSVDKVQK